MKQKKVRPSFRYALVVLLALRGLSVRKVRSLMVWPLIVLIAAWLGRSLGMDHKIVTTMLTLLPAFAIAIVANAVATYVSYRHGIRIGRLENGLRAYRTWRRIQSARALRA
ncbi:hypothetical protein [uncultured Bradyrhizobium sp.]|uniref:hypothetical protein n=1 Tax=uncultured Bradyrhizobium sp. TaxID=199684 RepID=UPI0026256172|nr:hypothetical protein [uncultured Bradyrhizobium sp.]